MTETDRIKEKMQRVGLWEKWAALRTRLIVDGMTDVRASQRAAKVLLQEQKAETGDAESLGEVELADLPGGADPLDEMDWVAEALCREDEDDIRGSPSKAAVSQLRMCRRHPALQVRLFSKRADLKDKAKTKRGGFNEFREIDLGGTLDRLARAVLRAEQEAGPGSDQGVIASVAESIAAAVSGSNAVVD